MKKNLKLFFIFGGLLVLDLILPDPVPIIDELLLMVATGYFGVKSI
jgi:hypothetical protein